MEITRQLRKDKLNKKGFAPIQITICWAGNRVRVSSGERCQLEHWDEENKKVKSVKGSFYNVINPKLNSIEEAAETAHYDAGQRHELLTEQALLQALEPILNPEKVAAAVAPAPEPDATDTRPLFLRLMQQWIQEYEQKIHPTTYRPISKTTLAGLVATMSRFEQFAAAKNHPLTLEGMDQAFYHQFRVYMMEELGQKLNTFGKHINRLRTFLAWCEDQDYSVNRRYRKFTAPSVYVGAEALTEAELRRIQEIDFASGPVQQRLLELRGAMRQKGNSAAQWSFQQWAAHVELARDKFLVCAYTALRISDAEQLAWHHVKGQMIHIKAGKNQQDCYIPFYDDSLFHLVALSERYRFRSTGELLMPTCYRVNEFLAIVQQLAGISRLKLTTKLGRKTFVTLKLYQGVPSRMVMQATGHTTEEAFNHYVGVDVLKLLQAFMHKSPKTAA